MLNSVAEGEDICLVDGTAPIDSVIASALSYIESPTPYNSKDRLYLLQQSLGVNVPIPSNTPINISGTWTCNDGGKYYITHKDHDVWWLGECQPLWCNVAHGSFCKGEILLSWCDIPKCANNLSGTLALRVKVELDFLIL